MKYLNGLAVLALVTAILMLGSTDSQGKQGACDQGGSMHVITIRRNEGAGPSVDKSDVTVCRGDTVQWVLTGPEPDRSYVINFVAGTPFEGVAQLGSSDRVVTAQVGGSAASGAYKYNVEVEGDPVLDPRIILD